VSADELVISSLSAGYPGRDVIRAITLAPIRSGQVTALVGPNAAGKSTLLRAISGVLPATGDVLFKGRNLLRLSPRSRAALLGFMPQNVPQGAGLSVLEGMLSALHVGGSTSADPIIDQAVRVLEQVGIMDIALRPFSGLSGGQRQLASLAQSIVRSPPLLLLDEPTSALDLGHQLDVMNLVRAYVAKDRIAIVVLHDLSFAARWADNIVVMAEGKLQAAGPPESAITPAILQSVYGVRARVERCSRGCLQVIVDGRVGDSSEGA